MTVCIAALADNNKKVYVISDCMISLNAPLPYQYETKDVPKIIGLTDNCVIMIAGNTVFGNEIATLSQNGIESGRPYSVEEIANEVLKAYRSYRLKLIEDAVLAPRQLTLSEYKEKQQTLNQEVVNSIENALTTTNIEVDIIVAGSDTTGCHIYTLTHPGIMLSFDSIGYACVGIGAPHAQLHFIDNDYTKKLSIENVKVLVGEAKKKSENAPGVGKQSLDLVLPKEEK